MENPNVGTVQNPEAMIEHSQSQIMSLASDEKRVVVVARLIEDFAADRASTLHKIECFELCLPEFRPVPRVAPFAHSDVATVGIAHLECQHVNVGPLLQLCHDFGQLKG